jgi:hypothetical protein
MRGNLIGYAIVVVTTAFLVGALWLVGLSAYSLVLSVRQ